MLLADIVAPLAGAWIEIVFDKAKIPGCIVAPLAGAWIEISNSPIIYLQAL